MKKSQRKVVAILIPSPLDEEGKVRKVRVRKTSPSPLKGEDKVRVKSDAISSGEVIKPGPDIRAACESHRLQKLALTGKQNLRNLNLINVDFS